MIYLDDAIEAIEEITWYHQNCNNEMVSGANSSEDQPWYKAEDVYKALENVPSAQPEQRWIPCSERLPGDLSEVNVTWINHNPEPYFEFSKDKPFTATAVYYKDKWYWYSATCADFLAEYGKCDWNEVDDAIEIVAWMPLPEPYAERREERI